MTTMLILVYVTGALVLLGFFAGIPMWMIHRYPDTAPDNNLPAHLQADWENLPTQNLAGTRQRPGR